MINTKKKGQKKELLCAHALEAEGYFIAFRAFTVKRGPFFVGVDFADTFDVVGIRPINGQTYDFLPHWRFISCSFASHRSEKIAAVEKFKKEMGIDSIRFAWEVWVWTPARWRGRGAKKHFEKAMWEKIVV